MFYRIIVFSVLFLFFNACKNDSNQVHDDEMSLGLTDSDTLQVAIDNDGEDDLHDQGIFENAEVQEAHKEIVKKYGVQWDFCTCVVKNDSVNKALEDDNLSDEAFDRLFDRSEFIDEKCKSLLIQPNQTPEDRAKHEKKVKDCLRNQK